MSGFSEDERHVVTFAVRGPKTTKQVKAYMKRLRGILRGLPGNIESQPVKATRGKPRTQRRKPKRRRTG